MIETDDLEKKLGITFKDKDYLLQALTHRSYLNENPSFRLGHNERLEFLGDAVLELVVTAALYKKYPEKPEGELTSLRAALVNGDTLAQAAGEIGLNDFMLLSRGEKKDTGRARSYILANAYEAFVGALYLDQGHKSCEEFIAKTILVKVDEVVEHKLWKDPKSMLQEEAQEQEGVTPTYRVLGESGPDHEKLFEVGVFLGKEQVGRGNGLSKQEAEEKAAEAAIEKRGWK
ncbi:MAG: ribonuclease III [bacterium]|nr:ribonuclease III [bacterium]